MRRMLAIATVALLAGCAGSGDGEPIVEFQADLEGTPGYENLEGSARAVASLGSTLVTVDLNGATPGDLHPWHVHDGSCGSGGGIVGDPAAYDPLEIDADGDETETARIDVQLDDDADYHVNVHLSPSELGTIVACGDLVD